MTTFCQVETLLQSLDLASPPETVRKLRVCISTQRSSDVNLSFTTENSKLFSFPWLTEVKVFSIQGSQ